MQASMRCEVNGVKPMAGMMDFEQDVRLGNIYRKRVCARCGAIDYERYRGRVGQDWEERPLYEGQGFGSIVIVPYVGADIERMEFMVCPECANTFKNLVDGYLKGE